MSSKAPVAFFLLICKSEGLTVGVTRTIDRPVAWPCRVRTGKAQIPAKL